MKKITKEELDVILTEHKKYLRGEGGSRANLCRASLSGADLSYADLSGASLSGADLSYADLRDANLRDADLIGADLRGADLRDVNLRDANLRGTDLRGADLRDADLRGADLCRVNLGDADLCGANLSGVSLRGANLTLVKGDYFDVLSTAIPELLRLKKAIVSGEIDGSTYGGPCACLCGTLEKTQDENIKKLVFDRRNSDRPIERFFLAINRGDTPRTSQFSALALEWLNEFIETTKPHVKEKL
jgi:hypothetical protein